MKHQTPETLTGLTDEDYALSAPVTPDALTAVLHTAQPFQALSDSAKQYLRLRAIDTLPTLASESPTVAAGVMLAHLRNIAVGTPTARDWREMMERRDWPIVLTTDEMAMRDLFETMVGAVLDGTAHEPAPRVLNTTRTHTPRADGQYRTIRKHVQVWDSAGNVRDAVDLESEANALLREAFPDEYGAELAPVGTPDQVWPLAVTYKPLTFDRGLGAWLLLDGTPATHAQLPTVRMPSGLSVLGHKSHVACGTPWKVTHSKPRKDGSLPNTVRFSRVVSPTELPNGTVWLREVNRQEWRTSMNGRYIIGHGHWEGVPKARKQSTTKAGRALAKKAAPVAVGVPVAEAAARAEAIALELHTAVTEAHHAQAVHAADAISSARTYEALTEAVATRANNVRSAATFSTDSGHVIRVGASHGKRYNVTVKYPNGDRKSTSTTAPAYVRAVVANLMR